jgi:hypothetical protein
MEQKTTTINGVKVRLKQLKAPQVMAFLTVYGKGLESDDFDAISKSYEELFSWVEAEVGGVWVAAYDKLSGTSIVDALASSFTDPAIIPQILNLLDSFLPRSSE